MWTPGGGLYDMLEKAKTIGKERKSWLPEAGLHNCIRADGVFCYFDRGGSYTTVYIYQN